ncbi:hypothetical protein RhiXN_06170 [Rhizoctonia solani]|uniref:Secreted protein n=1 Tax=Rhizoctonia solani TaxID=456999 RepID=A0A8H8NW41_9AGAM|nr:uncharacterized protein RhiXN_06170 [Rhizoctonia solani]QRW21181.1 hypothetical protein RhiXN_06170 [Rhizoctonia solani]
MSVQLSLSLIFVLSPKTHGLFPADQADSTPEPCCIPLPASTPSDSLHSIRTLLPPSARYTSASPRRGANSLSDSTETRLATRHHAIHTVTCTRPLYSPPLHNRWDDTHPVDPGSHFNALVGSQTLA